MGKRGPKPTPTALKLVRGNPGKRKLNKREPKPRRDPGVPKPLKWLDARAAAKWRELAPIVHGLGLLTVADHQAFALLCDALIRFERANAECAANGEVQTSAKNGYELARPVVRLRSIALAESLRLMDRFGMNPAARSSIQVEGPKERDALLEFLEE